MVLKSVRVSRLKNHGFSLILSGGAAYGIAHIGVIKFLEENNLRPKEVLGTSMGAIISALYCIGKSSGEMQDLINEIEKINLFKLKYGHGTLEYKRLHDFLKSIFKKRKMKDTILDLKIMATDMKTGQGKLFTKEDNVYLFDVIMASISIPGIFGLKKIKNKYYMDGGVFSNLPVEYANPKNIKIACNVINHTKHFKAKEKKGLFAKLEFKFSILSNTIYYLIENQTNSKIPYIKNLILIEPNLKGQKKYKIENSKRAIKIGYNETKKLIKR